VFLCTNKEGNEMALIQWDSSFSVNVTEIDKQHQKLVALMNDLNDAMKQGKGKDILAKIIGELFNYAGNHLRPKKSILTNLDTLLPQVTNLNTPIL